MREMDLMLGQIGLSVRQVCEGLRLASANGLPRLTDDIRRDAKLLAKTCAEAAAEIQSALDATEGKRP